MQEQYQRCLSLEKVKSHGVVKQQEHSSQQCLDGPGVNIVSFGGICSSHSALQNQIKNKHLNYISCLETLIMGAKVRLGCGAEFMSGEHGCQSASHLL